jgi:hypothetical protein
LQQDTTQLPVYVIAPETPRIIGSTLQWQPGTRTERELVPVFIKGKNFVFELRMLYIQK